MGENGDIGEAVAELQSAYMRFSHNDPFPQHTLRVNVKFRRLKSSASSLLKSSTAPAKFLYASA